MDPSPSFDPTLHYLGPLCARRHEWASTGGSLRYISTHQCRQCLRLAGRARVAEHLDDAGLATLVRLVPVRARLWSQLWAHLADAPQHECWIWRGGLDIFGRGHLGVSVHGRRKRVLAHRLAFLLAYGYLPPHPLVVRHLCGTAVCCNPTHLAPGTSQDNADDRGRHGRHTYGERNGQHIHPECTARGERHGNARWTEADVVEMRRQRAAGQTLRQIAVTFDTGRSTVQAIVTGQSWAHIGEPCVEVGARPARGESNGGARLSSAQVEDLRRLHACGHSRGELATMFGVSSRHVYDILTAKLWRDSTTEDTYRRLPRPRGEQHARAKMTDQTVRELRRLRRDGVTLGDLSARFGIAVSTVKAIIRGDAWGHVL